jgi:hypothetical protein
MAKLDWLLAYQSALSNTFGDKSQEMIENIKKAAGSDFQEAIDKGYISPPTTKTTKTLTDSGEVDVETPSGEVYWDKIPKLPTAPKGYDFQTVSINGSTGVVQNGKELGYYNDPNYGMLGLYRSKTPKDLVDIILPAIALSFAGGPIAAGIGGGLGLTAGSFAQTALSTGVKASLSAAIGNTPSLQGTAFSLLKPSFINFIKGGF